MSPESVVLFRSAGSVIIALLFVVSFWIVVVPMFEGDKKKKRMEAVATARENMRKSRLDNLQAEARLRSDGKGVAKNLVDRFSLEKLLEASDLKDKMAQAGLRGQKPVYIFYMSRLVLPIALGLFGLLTLILSYLTSRRLAYENLARRNNHPGIRAVATALVQAERYGTPLGDTLRTMANENRQLRVMQAEKKAAALPAKLTVPMILFFLPVLFIVILTPAALRMSQAF